MLKIRSLNVGYDNKSIINNLNLNICKGEIVSIIGPNGCGKSTLLNTISRIIKRNSGDILIDNKSIFTMNSKDLSTKLAIVSQHHIVPQGITVKELIYYGRLPHKKWYEVESTEDKKIIDLVLKQTKLVKYSDTRVSELSGGERQRVWLAMALAQKTHILLLDEPTTYLDISYQLDLMDLIKEINNKLDITIIMVLHDINQASEFSDKIIVMKDGRVVAKGTPEEVINISNIKNTYNIDCEIELGKRSHKPRIYPISNKLKVVEMNS